MEKHPQKWGLWGDLRGVRGKNRPKNGSNGVVTGYLGGKEWPHGKKYPKNGGDKRFGGEEWPQSQKKKQPKNGG